ncbi:hypothetical protein HPB48_014404 [Haemaphysalis longicornis]|uniref:Transposable element n=1 Tax=Haemaphysalis longicornis TaxID=44386 RepID=A0A9J6GKX0_HAELO|nr:hypothetical protein HPB48_014404 [Haemaphysalis longicornis]
MNLSVEALVCELHFQPSDLVTTLSHCDEATGKTTEVKSARVYLKEGAVPAVFPNCPTYLTTTPSHRESPASNAVPHEVRDINSLSLLLEKLEKHSTKVREVTDETTVTVLKFVLSLLDELALQNTDTTEEGALIKFLVERIKLVVGKSRRYSAELLVFASLLHSISPHAYRFARSKSGLILPHQATLRRLCSKYEGDPSKEQNEAQFLSYICERAKWLEPHEKTVTMMVDEVHVKPYFDFKGGSIAGSSAHLSEPATTCHIFIIQCRLSSNKDVVPLLPVSRLSAETLQEFTKGIILKMEEIGLKVMAVITDNNAINRKMMSLFAESPHLSIVHPHPADKSRPLFYIVDPVHILKCIRNNWINQKNPGT